MVARQPLHATDKTLRKTVGFLLIGGVAVIDATPERPRFVGSAVQNYCQDAQIPDAEVLGRLVRYGIMLFVVMIALSQVEVGGDIVQRTFLIILAGLMLAIALAFGLGGKDWAASMLQRWWPQHRKDGER